MTASTPPDPLPSGVVTARRVADRLCWGDPHSLDGYTVHTGHAPLSDGPEFVHALGAFQHSGPMRLLSDGGNYPYTLAVAADNERALIYYVEGDVTVRFYDAEDRYRQAVEEWERS